jgi:hypothetical protein
MKETAYSSIQFSPGPEWSARDEQEYLKSDISPLEDPAYSNEWNALPSTAKAIMISYRRALIMGDTVPSMLIMAVNDIHNNHPDFHIGHMPKMPPNNKLGL